MISELVIDLYAALAAGDRGRVEALLAPGFVAEFSAGLPAPIGGRHLGGDAIDSGWWEIGRRFRLHVAVDDMVTTTDGRLLVLGRYLPVQAAFAHVWSAADNQITTLKQVTDTVTWLAEPAVSQPATN